MNAKQQQFETAANVLNALTDDMNPYRCEALKNCANAMREAAQGHARYEALRCLTPRDWMGLWQRNMAGENFDAMADELVKAKNEKT